MITDKLHLSASVLALPHYAQKIIYYAIFQSSQKLPIMLLILTNYSTLCVLKIHYTTQNSCFSVQF